METLTGLGTTTSGILPATLQRRDNLPTRERLRLLEDDVQRIIEILQALQQRIATGGT